MKKTIIIAFAMLSSAASFAQGKYTVSGTVPKSMNGSKMYISIINTKNLRESEVKDSVVISDQKFSFTIDTDRPFVEAYIHGDALAGTRKKCIYPFYIEDTNVTINIKDAEDYSSAEAEGGAEMMIKKEFDSMSNPRIAKLNEMTAKIRSEEDDAAREALEKENAKLEEEYSQFEKDFFSKYPNSYQTFIQKIYILGRLDYQGIKAEVEKIPAKFAETRIAHEIREEFKKQSGCVPGSTAPDFTDVDINGKQFTLSSLKGHYIILDFWASWCVPCRKSMPHVKALYEKYKGKGLEVVCIADDDSKKEAWYKAVADDKLEPFHNVLRGLKRVQIGDSWQYDHSADKSDLYAVHYLPTKFLIDPEGKVVGKVDDQELDDKLKEIYGY